MVWARAGAVVGPGHIIVAKNGIGSGGWGFVFTTDLVTTRSPGGCHTLVIVIWSMSGGQAQRVVGLGWFLSFHRDGFGRYTHVLAVLKKMHAHIGSEDVLHFLRRYHELLLEGRPPAEFSHLSDEIEGNRVGSKQGKRGHPGLLENDEAGLLSEPMSSVCSGVVQILRNRVSGFFVIFSPLRPAIRSELTCLQGCYIAVSSRPTSAALFPWNPAQTT